MRKVSVSVISDNRNLSDSMSELLKNSSENIIARSFFFESAFIDTIGGGEFDIIISDRTGKSAGWEKFKDRVLEILPEALVVFIIDGSEKNVKGEMLRNGVYEVISDIAPDTVSVFIQKALRDIEANTNLRYLIREKTLNDHIVNCSRSMLSIINRDYIYEKVNATFCSAHNVVVDNIVGKSLSEIWGAEAFNDKIKPNLDLCFEGNTVRYEAYFQTPYFGNRYYEVVFRPIFSSDGTVSNLIAETFDITELKLSQKVLNEMEEEFKKLETNLPIGFLRCDKDGIIIHANRAFIKIMGCNEETGFSGMNISDFYAEKGLFEIHLRQLRNEQSKTFGRVPLFTCTGEEIVCRISGFVVVNEKGEPSYIDFAFEDSSRELMLENRLLQAQKLETIGALAGGLAHDFNNILSTIFGYSELLLEEVPKNSQLSDKVIKIISAITRARSLTSQILTFSRQIEQQKIAVNIYEVLNETIGFVESAKPDNIKIERSISDHNIHVFADPTQLFRVFLNLMTNGIQAMETNGGVLSIRLEIYEGKQLRDQLSKNIVADEYACISINDTGVGMEPSVVQRIFEPYFTTKDVGKGTGLGLSVSHGIVSEIEGEITVRSRKGRGSEFTIYLPVTRGKPEAGTEFNDKQLLIITGNPHESRILSLALEKSGYKLKYITDSAKLRKALTNEGNHPDIIIYMDESEYVKTDDITSIYSEKKFSTPLILITDSDQYSSKEKLLNSGIAKQVLIKPVSLREIHTAIQMSLT
jgi:PAS domain S-box-containing protein